MTTIYNEPGVKPWVLEGDYSWQEHALCLGAEGVPTKDGELLPVPDAFYPERGQSAEPAKQFCKGCPVQSECLKFALDNGEKFGVWGGFSERERKRMRDARTAYIQSTG